MKPEWESAFSMKNEKYDVVETDLMIKGIIRFTDKDCMEKFRETKDMKYKQSYARLVFRTDRKTGNTAGFLMTIVPNLEWLEKSDFKPFKKTNYFDKGKDFSGWILFHNMDGSFSNGWVYEKGKIVASIGSLGAEPAEGSFRSEICDYVNYYYEWEECGDYYSGSEEYGFHYVGTICHSYWEYEYSTYVCYDDGSSGGSGGDGGYTGGGSGNNNNNNPKTPELETDCQPQAAANSTAINNALSSTYSGAPGNEVAANISILKGMAYNMTNEYGIAVQYAGGQYYVFNQGDYNNSYYFVSGEPNMVKIGTNENTYLVAHTHPYGDNSAPSPLDAIFLAKAYKGGSTNITANLEYAVNGSVYMVCVNDRDAFGAFCNNQNNSQTIDYDGTAFYPGSSLATDYTNAYNKLKLQGFTDNDAQSYALSYALDHNNTGLKVYQNKDGNFKEQTTDSTTSGSNTTYSPKICQ